MKKIAIMMGALVLMLGSVTFVWAQRGPGFSGRPIGPGFNGTATGPGFNGTARGPGFNGTATGPGFNGTARGPGFNGVPRGPGFNGNPNAFPVERNQPGIGFDARRFSMPLRPNRGF